MVSSPTEGLLFANYDFKSSPSLPTTPRAGSVKSLKWAPPSSPGLLGYLAFPGSASSQSTSTDTPEPVEKISRSLPASADGVSEKHLARLERERAEILRGEEDWVRSGGILRDSEYKRDFARTESVRKEIRLKEWENEVQRRWEEYERRWTELQSMVASSEPTSPLTFGSIPWPVRAGNDVLNSRRLSSGTWNNKTPNEAEIGLSDLTPQNIEAFLLDPLNVRGCKVTRKERKFSQLLRWHPDKLTALLLKVVEDDRRDVDNGISSVVRCLQEMNSKQY
ncbi:hypothetical protein D9757_007078 [Collybiopsis confluens]|uniref:Uncharacterized protein n=1 Tax=Collybiopsis confluens TaxID=2823264 RepID=A0A8H5HCU2_9AGAR|nr:hypothetical protein D9757_007078 [Collybiopsis confluens]